MSPVNDETNLTLQSVIAFAVKVPVEETTNAIASSTCRNMALFLLRNGFKRCHFRLARQFSKNFRAQASRLESSVARRIP